MSTHVSWVSSHSFTLYEFKLNRMAGCDAVHIFIFVRSWHIIRLPSIDNVLPLNGFARTSRWQQQRLIMLFAFIYWIVTVYFFSFLFRLAIRTPVGVRLAQTPLLDKTPLGHLISFIALYVNLINFVNFRKTNLSTIIWTNSTPRYRYQLFEAVIGLVETQACVGLRRWWYFHIII